MRMCELKAREVINICSGKRLGGLDVEIDPCSGAVESVIIPGPGGFAASSEQTASM